MKKREQYLRDNEALRLLLIEKDTIFELDNAIQHGFSVSLV
ncbi:hypothetical protein OO184_19990 [Photorhabdus sp. APURE]|nr:hypothetical protein [Photorhabdus aballayi]MCW7550149.1 hypothetical protein [Photorhabdus aballayi]